MPRKVKVEGQQKVKENTSYRAATSDYFYIVLLPLFLNKWINVIADRKEGFV